MNELSCIPQARLCTCELRGETPRICSHVAVQTTKAGEPMFKDLKALTAACELLGLEVVNTSKYRWYGRSVGDYPVPKGMRARELGNNALFVLRIKEPLRSQLTARYGEQPYEIGIVEDPNNAGCYLPIYDFFCGGYGLTDVVGQHVGNAAGQTTMLAPKLKQYYDMCCDRLAAGEVGDEIEFLSLKAAAVKYPQHFQPSEDEETFVSVAKTEARVGV